MIMDWLPPGKRAAVCISVDDVHPAAVAFEALGHVRRLQEQHRGLRVTLFTTPDWRTRAPFPSGGLMQRIPGVRNALFMVPVEKKGIYRLDRHPEFCDFLRGWERAEIALHGLHHVRRGMRPIHEFGGRSRRQSRSILRAAIGVIEDARLSLATGMSPPGWEASAALLDAMADVGLTFVASARDLDTPVSREATTHGSGLRGVSMIHPERLACGLVHFATNYQATSTIERGLDILEAGGLLAIKAHLLAGAPSGSYRALDGLTNEYADHLHRLFAAIEDRFGDEVWWTSMGEIASRLGR